MIHYNPTVSGSLVVTGSLITTGNINGINLSTFSASINNALTESKVTHIVSQSSGVYYIDGVQKPSMSFVTGLTYRFDTTITDDPMHLHPFKFSTSPNGPTQYVDGVTSGSNYIQIETSYNTPELLYYHCAIHNGMGNAINVLKIDKLLTTVSSSFDTRYVISGSITQTTWDNIASKPSGIVSSSVQVLGGTNIVSGSSQLTASALATTGSNTFIGNQNISGTIYLTGSIIPSGSFVYDLGSETNSFGDLFISTGSIRFHNPDGTEQGRITVDAKSGDISLLKTAGLTNEQKLTIKQGNINPTFLSAISASNLFVQTKIVMPAGGTVNGINLTAFSSSVANSTLNQNSFTASNGNTSLNNLTGSLATTGSNTFFGTQTFSGSVYIANDLIVQGSSSIQYISASSVSIGTNIVQLNTANPSVRFAGLTIIDSGSVGGSGSFLYDSVQDEFIFVHRGNGVNVTSSHFILGPETYDNLGNETYLTTNILPKGTGKEHLNDSNITDTGTLITLGSNTIVNGTLLASGTSLVSSSAQVVEILSSLNTYTSSLKTALQLTGSNVVVSGDLTVLGTTNTANSTTLNISDKFITLASGSTSSAIANGAGFRIAGANVTMSWESANSQLKFNTDISASKFYGDGTGLIFNGSGIVSSSVQTIANLPTDTVSGSSQVVGILSSLNTYTGSNDTTNTAQNARLTTIESVTGSYETKGSGIVSGSSQITYTGISSIPSGIVSGSSQTIANLPTGTVSGSSQVTLSSTTGFGTYINQAVLTSSNVTFARVTTPKIAFERNANTANGLSWYSFGTYTAWCDYMANGGATSTGPTGNITASTGTYVTSWARRFFVEDANTYGWIFEKGGTTSTTPTVVAELRSSDGLFSTAGEIYSAASLVKTSANSSYSTTFTSVSSVSVTHSLGTKNVMVMCYGSDDEMFWPATIKTTSTTVVDITFTTARTGRVVIIR